MVTYPKIEALWKPKQQLNSTEDVATLVDNNSTKNNQSTKDDSNNRAEQDEQKNLQQQHHQLHHRHVHLPRIRNLLAALNFEHNNNHHQQQPQQPQPHNENSTEKYVEKQQEVAGNDNVDNKQSSLHTPSKDLRGSSASSRLQQQRLSKGTTVLRASMDSSNDIFYDALQYGNSPINPNDFVSDLVAPPRESVVLSNIITTMSYTPTNNNSRNKNNQNQYEGRIETVLKSDNDDHNDTHKDKSVEYTEHEFHANRSINDYDNSSTSPIEVSDDVMSYQQSTTKITQSMYPAKAPPPPEELPLRFLRAGKNDPTVGIQRYNATLEMRRTNQIDTILREPSPKFHIIKKYYPHYCHYPGKNNEPCFYEQPPKTNLKELRKNGITLDQLLRHYTMVTEYQWQYIERDDLAKSIYIIDLDGIRITDFAGEAVDFVKRASAFSAQHYPERAGYVFVINVPGWFKLIWNVVKPIIDEDTLKKIYILRGKDEIRNAMQERIDIEFIPPEYGGTSVPLGQSPQEKTLAEWMEHNNILAAQQRTACVNCIDCKFCTWTPARSY